jgi:H+/gluconate symporter-like permease
MEHALIMFGGIVGIFILLIVGVVVMLNYNKAVKNEIERQNREREKNNIRYYK